MPRQIKGMEISIVVSKDTAGQVEVNTTAHVLIGFSEYPEIQHKVGREVVNTAAEKTAIINYAKKKLDEIKAAYNAEDGIPIPEPAPEPAPEP